MVENLGRQAELRGDCVVFRVKVDRSLTPQEVISRINGNHMIEPRVIRTMPKGEGDVVDVHFFKLDEKIRHDQLALEYKRRNLKSDPYAQAAVDKVDPRFVDTHPNIGHWKDEDGRWCYLGLGCLDPSNRMLLLEGPHNSFSANWWFAGVPI